MGNYLPGLRRPCRATIRCARNDARMSDLIFSRADFFPPGTALSLWPQAKVGEPWRLKNEVPVTATDTCTVDADGLATFTGATHGEPYVAGGRVTPAAAVASVSGATTSWTVTLTGATGGTFTITLGANETDPIDFDATSNDVLAAIDAATTDTNIVVGDAGGPWVLTLDTSATVTVDGALLTAASELRYLACNTGSYVAPTRIPHPYGS